MGAGVTADTAHDIAAAILSGFDKHYRIFREMAAYARVRFERADWTAVRNAARARIDLYDQRVREAVAAIAVGFPAACADETLWPSIKAAYIAQLRGHRRPECAETFFNSVACRVLNRTYYRNEYIFWHSAVSPDSIDAAASTWRSYDPAASGLRCTMRAIVADLGLRVPFEDLARDLRHVVRALREQYPAREREPVTIEVLSSLFFRNTGAYLVGRIVSPGHERPFAVSLRHSPSGNGLCLDALLLTSAQIGRLFNLARAYFIVDMDVPSAYVTFLRRLLPDHTEVDLYTAVGLQKQGKTLAYRQLHDHLSRSSDTFVEAPGVRGLVMVVFTLPSYPHVFKVIRDECRPPKRTTPDEVRRKYYLVKHHDRVGRMADMYEYVDVALPLDRIDADVLAELESSCASLVERDGDQLIIRHLYIERRMTPLDVFLRAVDDDTARRTIEEYGLAIRELAEADIFPGDLLCKNFGVTRAGRVVFYDYDEVCPLGDMVFRRLPPTRDDDELSAEPTFYVGPNDAFPEEWPTFLFPLGPQRAAFLAAHPELVSAAWWSALQREIQLGTMPELYPYPQALRFAVRYGA